MGMPPELHEFARAKVRQQEAQERGANVQALEEVLFNNNDNEDDNGVPEVYHGESDADEFSSFVAGSSNGSGSVGEGGEEDESLRTLEAQLMMN